MKLSIITPVYNGEKYIEKFTNDILKQTYSDFELIIINDGSKDKTKIICEKLKKLDKRIKVIHTENKGVSSARNTGIEIAGGDYISFVDCDDTIKINMYSDMIKLFEEKSTDIILCAYWIEYNNIIEEYEYPFKDRYFNKEEIKDDLLMRLIVKMDRNDNQIESIYGAVWKCLFRRAIIEENNVYFNKNIKMGEDLVFLFKYLVNSNSAFITNNRYYVYNKKTDNGISVTQGYIKSLENDYKEAEIEILASLNEPEFIKSKAWKNKKVIETIELALNEGSKFSSKSMSDRIKNIKDILDKTDFNKNLKALNKNERYEMNNKVIFLLKNRFIYIFLLLLSRKE